MLNNNKRLICGMSESEYWNRYGNLIRQPIIIPDKFKHLFYSGRRFRLNSVGFPVEVID
jgi:hypothetical protein